MVTNDSLNVLPCANRRVPSALGVSALISPLALPPPEATGAAQVIEPLAEDVELFEPVGGVEPEPLEVEPEGGVEPEPEPEVGGGGGGVETVPEVGVDWIQQALFTP